MDIKQLIYLCNLERERHFGRAAEASFVSQPTLSMRLKNLERELGVALINRGNNFEGFTAEGERVLAWAREIVSVYQGLKLEIESLKKWFEWHLAYWRGAAMQYLIGTAAKKCQRALSPVGLSGIGVKCGSVAGGADWPFS